MPQIIEVTVGAATSFNHPHESYANFKPSVTLKALVSEREDAHAVIRTLQQRAHDVIVAEKTRILDEIDREERIKTLEREIESDEHNIAECDKVLKAPEEEQNRRHAEARSHFWNVHDQEAFTLDVYLSQVRENREKNILAIARARAELGTLNSL